MQSVITVEQARKITKGRTPHVPVEYETACKALEACCTLEEGKYWSDKADALAAWAKIFHDSKIERQARALKLRAYARMGELAKELCPSKVSQGRAGFRGPSTELRERAGLSRGDAQAAIALSRVSLEERTKLESYARIPTPHTALAKVLWENNAASGVLYKLTQLATSCRSVSPGEVKKYAATQRASKLMETAEEVHDWLGLLLGKD